MHPPVRDAARPPATASKVAPAPACARAGAGVAALQRSLGNRAVGRALAGAAGAAVRDAGGGAALAPGVRARMEASFGRDLGGVRVHESAAAAALGAEAFTVGEHVHFAPGRYDPGSRGGSRLLGHELAHVLQQRAGRAPALGAGVTVTVDRALEREAETAGASAARGEPARVAGSGSRPAAAPAVLQPRLGFELELHVLVDIDGRPPPEKVPLGTYGVHNLSLTVDQSGDVEGQTPTRAVRANWAVPVGGAPAVALGAYDLPAGWDTYMDVGTAAADPRGLVATKRLGLAAWQARTPNLAATPFGRAANNANLNNAALTAIDGLLPRYAQERRQYEPARAVEVLGLVHAQIAAWRAANPKPGLLSPVLRSRHGDVATQLTKLEAEVGRHVAFWYAHWDPAPGMERRYRQTPLGAPPGAWQARHPLGPGMGGEKYASILEIVTPGGVGYEPETLNGRNAIVGAMTEAVTLANAIDAAVVNPPNPPRPRRVRLNTIPNTNVTNADTFVGNTGQTRNPQRVDASIQATFAVDLAHMASLHRSLMTAINVPQQLFTMKHHNDPSDPGVVELAKSQLPRAGVAAAAAINAVQPAGVGGRPSLVNLRGLLTMIAQYLIYGRFFYSGPPHQGGGLDKNIAPLLSRTDLAVLYNQQVPAAERAWVTANLAALRTELLQRTGRGGGNNRLFTDPTLAAASAAGAPPWNVTALQFVNNVLTPPAAGAAPADGVTAHFGGFRPMAAESIDPGGARAGDTRRAGAAQREGPVLELRNLVPRDFAQTLEHRLAPNTWVALATHFADMLAAINARTEAQAVRDVQYRAAAGMAPAGLQAAAANW